MARKKRSLGFGFSDEVVKVNSKRATGKSLQDADWKDWLIPNFSGTSEDIQIGIWRPTILLVFTITSFFAIFLRLFHLQIAYGEKSRELADGNRIQIKVIHAPRGVIYDRNGKILAGSSPAFRLEDMDGARLITREEALELEVKEDVRVKDLEVDNVRTYPKGEILAHVVGYVGEISEEDLKKDKYKTYRLGDRIGQSGIEAQYEDLLRGKDGGEVIEVDSKGQKVRTIRRNAPIAGQNIYLTLDSDISEKLYSLMNAAFETTGACCAAAVAMDPQFGQILSLISLPAFDPNVFTKPTEETEIPKIFQRADSPILNRVIAGTYPPGSTFKIITSLAALSSGKVTKDTVFEDTGVIYLGPFKFSNWYFNQYGKTEGAVNIVKALQRSNDTYYYQAARLIGEDAITDWSKKIGLGSKLNIDLPGEEAGLVPTDGWKRQTFGEGWYPGDTLHMAIGQGFVLMTPLQVMGMTSFIAADGVLYKPQIFLRATRGEFTSKEEFVTKEFKKEVLVSNLASEESIKLIKEGLEKVPKSGGTAWPFFTFPMDTAGKTGTAEYGHPKNRTHAWYTSYAPANDPKIVLTILIEGGGEGSSVAAPIAKEIYRWFFSPDKSQLIKDVYVSATESGRTLGE